MSVNSVTLVGRVGKDPEVRTFENGSSVANFSLATTERGYTAKNGTEVPDRTEWHSIVCWKGLAKIAQSYVTKGTQLYIQGSIRSRTYEDANNVKRTIVEIYADKIELLGSSDRTNQPQNNTAASPQQQDDDDLPF